MNLIEKRNDGLSSQLRVLLVVGLLVALVLLHGPVGHLQKAHQREQVGERECSHDGETHPRENLKGVIRARHVVEQES